MVSVSCFGVRVSVMFHFMCLIILLVQFGLLSGHLLGNSYCILSICDIRLFPVLILRAGFAF